MVTGPVTDISRLCEWLERLSNEVGVSGRERAVRRILRDELEGHVDSMTVDALGNLIATKRGTGGEPRMKVMLAAHMDEVGFMITSVDKSGLLRFSQVGGLVPSALLAKRVVIGDERVPGIIGAAPPHLLTKEQERKAVELDSLTIDIGATSQKEAEGKVSVGSYGTFATRFTSLFDDPAWPTVRGKALDDRAGCTALLALLHGEYPVDVFGVFTVQEEIGLRGAGVAAYRLEPDAAFVLEGTICDDTPLDEGEDHTPVTVMGAGPATALMDNRAIAHPGLLKLLRETAAEQSLPLQMRAPGMGGTDAGSIQLAGIGVPAAVLATPCRYIHMPAAILNLNDLANGVRLMAAVLGRLDRTWLERGYQPEGGERA